MAAGRNGHRPWTTEPKYPKQAWLDVSRAGTSFMSPTVDHRSGAPAGLPDETPNKERPRRSGALDRSGFDRQNRTWLHPTTAHRQHAQQTDADQAQHGRCRDLHAVTADPDRQMADLLGVIEIIRIIEKH